MPCLSRFIRSFRTAFELIVATPAHNQGTLKRYPVAQAVDAGALLEARSGLFARCGKFMASNEDMSDAALMTFFAKTEEVYVKDLKGADALSAPPGNPLYTAPTQTSWSASGGSYSLHHTFFNSPLATSFRKLPFILSV